MIPSHRDHPKGSVEGVGCNVGFCDKQGDRVSVVILRPERQRADHVATKTLTAKSMAGFNRVKHRDAVMNGAKGSACWPVLNAAQYSGFWASGPVHNCEAGVINATCIPDFGLRC